MANGNAAMGLIPRRTRVGDGTSGSLNRYCIPASDATAYYIGDPVIIAGDADVDGTTATVTIATAGTGRITGVIVGFDPTPSIVTNGYGVASTLRYPLVCDDVDGEFEIQEDGIGGTLTTASVGLNAALIAGTGSNFTGKSGWMLDSSTAATTAGLQVRIVGLENRADNEPGANAKWLVRINAATELALSTGTGV